MGIYINAKTGKYAIFILLGIAALGLLIMLLWNWLIPDITGWSEISMLQAIGLLVLCKILFGNSSNARGRRSSFKQRFRKRVDRMSEEERAELRVILAGKREGEG